MLQVLDELGFKHRASPPNTHERNGIAERSIQIVMNTLRASLKQAGFDRSFWTVALRHAVFLRNRVPTAALDGKSPLEFLTKVPQDLNKLHPFGCSVHVKVEDQMRQSLDPKARVGVYVGHDTTCNEARVMLLDKKRIVFVSTYHCVVNDSVFPFPELFAERNSTAADAAMAQDAPVAPVAPAGDTVVGGAETGEQQPAGKDAAGNDMWLVDRILQHRRAERVKRGKPRWQYLVRWQGCDASHDSWESESILKRTDALRDYKQRNKLDGSEQELDADVAATVNSVKSVPDVKVPRNYNQAMSSPQSDEWQAAVTSEVASLVENGVFEYVPIAQASHILNTQWVFTVKQTEEGADELKFKARLVARGDHQRDIELGDIYAPVVNHTTLRAMLAVAAVKDYHLHQMDAVTAFLNAPLDTDVFLRVPQGVNKYPPGVSQGEFVLKLKKSLYGLRQAPRQWNQLLHDFLVNNLQMQQSQGDKCLYFIPGKLWVGVWVDDFVLLGADMDVMNQFKHQISEKFKMRDMGELKHFLGFEVSRDREAHTLTISSPQYVQDMLERFGMSKAKGATSPLPANIELKPTPPGSATLTAEYPYRSLIGSLQYLGYTTRPDIAFAVSTLARFQTAPSMEHWDAAKHVLRYVKTTAQEGLTYSSLPLPVTSQNGVDAYSAGKADKLFGYTDASWADDVSTRQSQTGYAFMFGGAAISWQTKLQKVVTLSSTEAEYVALSSAVQEVLYLQKIFADLSLPQESVLVFEDNQSTIKLAQNPSRQFSARTKHIDIKHNFVKQCVESGTVLYYSTFRPIFRLLIA